jgi:hypothetical protein
MVGNCRAIAEKLAPPTLCIADYSDIFSSVHSLLCQSGVTVKIETIRGADGTIIRLIGQLEAEYLPELKAQIEAGGCAVVLEMDEVTLVDLDVVRFLIDCQARGILLRGCSAYIREWIAREHENET